MDTESIAKSILDRRFLEYTKKEFDDYELEPRKMTYEEWENWEPTKEDTAGIIESIKYWSTVALPRGDKSTWNKLQREIANECMKKELMLYESLGKSMREDLFVKGLLTSSSS